MKPPFPFYGSKRRHAEEVWARLGTPDVYAEPFAGSLAVLLHKSEPCKAEIVCDTNGLIANFWRAVKSDPAGVASHADYPTFHHDLSARHAWLMNRLDEVSAQLLADPEWYDAKVAGWWVWGQSNWTGADWCAKRAPSEKRPYVGAPPWKAMGLSAQGGHGGQSSALSPGERLLPVLDELSKRLSSIIVLNRGWESCLTNRVLGQRADRQQFASVGVFLDPPYIQQDRSSNLYLSDGDGLSTGVAESSYQWAVENGDRYRIAYCCHGGDFPVPNGWSVSSRNVTARNKSSSKKDEIYFSPTCLSLDP